MSKRNISICLHSVLVILCILASCNSKNPKLAALAISINADKQYQSIDGFGVNINPDRWVQGNLDKAIDLLVDDLGCTLFRFDCIGLANWLDPAKRNKDGTYSMDYLKEVYTNQKFENAWKTFRYLNSKGIEPFFNISGKIPNALGARDNPKQLTDFEGYAEMVVNMLEWARNKEKLKFSLFAPFNETDLSYPEGPGIAAKDAVPAIHSIINKLKEHGLNDIKIMVMDDNGVRFGKLRTILTDNSFISAISIFAVHTYGMGHEQYSGWWESKSDYGKLNDSIKNSVYKNTSLWMTEFGDLDQTGLIENEFSWIVTKRLMKALKDGYSACIFWDAFDNFHQHDQAWSSYGLLATDTVNWKYAPKHRYYALKQVYKYVLPGFRMVGAERFRKMDSCDVYREYHDTLKHIPILAFVSADKKDFTIVGMNNIEQDINLEIHLKGFASGSQFKEILYYRTNHGENCDKIGKIQNSSGAINIVLKGNSVFTLTTLQLK